MVFPRDPEEGRPCLCYRGRQKILGVSCQCALGKEGFSLPRRFNPEHTGKMHTLGHLRGSTVRKPALKQLTCSGGGTASVYRALLQPLSLLLESGRKW